MPTRLSRREFVVVAAGTLAVARPAWPQTLTAGALADRIRSNIGVPWNEKTLDGMKAGDPAVSITGITVTVMATLDVLRRSAAAGRNFIVTQEPVFYAANDTPGPREADPIYLAKKALIDRERLVVYRFAEHWHASQPDAAARSLAQALGWNRAAADDAQLYAVSPTTLAALAADARTRLGARGGVRVVGRPDLPVRTVYVSPATTTVPGVLARIARADVVVAGEPREWEVVPYVADTIAAGQPRGLISLGRVVSEGPCAVEQAAWLRRVAGGLPVEVARLEDPYWSPDA